MKSYTGKVISTKMQKTAVVQRTVIRAHPLYKKIMRSKKNVKAHCELPVKVGDKVEFVSTKPLSKHKHFRVVRKVEKT